MLTEISACLPYTLTLLLIITSWAGTLCYNDKRKKEEHVLATYLQFLVQWTDFFSRFQKGNQDLAQSFCSGLKNLQIWETVQIQIYWYWIPFPTTFKAPPQSQTPIFFLSLTLFPLLGISFIHVFSYTKNICKTLTMCLRIGLALGKYMDRNMWLPSRSRTCWEGQVWARRTQHSVACSLSKK